MREYKINRPDEAAMRRILEREQTGPAGLILRLAWLQGLSRDEIAALTWDQADLEAAVLRLPDRTVPLCPEMCAFLRRLRGAQGETPRVLVSERTGGAVPPESISRLARKALDREGQTAVRLMDLRHDWIIRQLAELDWPAAARVSGVAVPALQARFAAYAPSKRPARAEEKPLVDEFQLWKVLQAERDTPAGLALWLAWQMGLQAQEIAALTWDQVDLAANALRLPDREVLLTNAVRRLLQDAWDARVPGDDPHVLLTVRSRRPVDLARLSRMTRAALIRGGMDRVLLRDLRRDEGRRGAGPDRAKVPASLPRKAPAEDRMTRADGMASGQSPLCGERLLAVPRAPGARFPPREYPKRGARPPSLCRRGGGWGKAAKRRLRRMKRAGFENAARLAGAKRPGIVSPRRCSKSKSPRIPAARPRTPVVILSWQMLDSYHTPFFSSVKRPAKALHCLDSCDRVSLREAPDGSLSVRKFAGLTSPRCRDRAAGEGRRVSQKF